METSLVALAIKILPIAVELLKDLPALREAATTKDRQRLDELYAQFAQTSNDVADRLRATPDDPA